MSSEHSEFIDARVGPRGSLENLSQDEIVKLLDQSKGGLYELFRDYYRQDPARWPAFPS